MEEFFEMERKWTANLEAGALPPLDLLPILRLVPERWAKWKGISREIRECQRNLYFPLVDRGRRRIREDCRNDCFMEYLLDHQERYGLSDEMLA